MSEPLPHPAGWEIAVELLRTSRAFLDALHSRLAGRGHEGVRPAHGYALQAISRGADSAGLLGGRLGMTKQAGGQLVDDLTRLGYVERRPDPSDGRRKRIALTAHGTEMLDLSAEIFEELRVEWAATLPPGALDQLVATLVAGSELFGGSDGLRPIW